MTNAKPYWWETSLDVDDTEKRSQTWIFCVMTMANQQSKNGLIDMIFIIQVSVLIFIFQRLFINLLDLVHNHL